ncbi:FAD-dependent oxidoreductase [Devosia ginsengisoli]|uniref:FAD-dependent oxidoreductase n=1 Tax=Devosia ginsengisoli TaxID=400770 RepID=A0A5B8LZF9_9HYPH|nr:FAD-dependent oxidoreductase [Devosia ginsengisoli]QDZ12760.1 FAD-dependent oxidoreductase [Devosia ginsengisoli]
MIVAKYLVIGAGLSGAAIAWRLAQTGAEVAILEQDLPASVQGSSHGSSRIFRYTHHEGRFTGLAKRARAGWEELEIESGNKIMHANGALDFGAACDIPALARALEAESIEHEVLSAAAASQRWPTIRFDTDALWHPGAAVVDTEVGVWNMIGLAQGLGAQLVTEFTVSSVERTRTGYRVSAEDGRVAEGSEVIVATGGRLSELLRIAPVPRSLHAAIESIEVLQQHVFHFPYQKPIGWDESLWPSVIHKAIGREIHSLPGRRDAGYAGQKIYQFNSGRAIGSAVRQDVFVDGHDRDHMAEYVERQFPGLGTEAYAEGHCMAANTPGGTLVLERDEGFTIVSPSASHGASLAPLIGEFVADLVRGNLVSDTLLRADQV